MNLEKAREDYKRDGFAVIPGVFTAQEVGHIRFAAYVLLKSYPEQAQWVGTKPTLFFWPKNISQVLKAFVEDPRMVAVVRGFLGNETRQLLNQIHFRQPNTGEEYGWHQDIAFRVPAADFYGGLEQAFLQTAICVDPMTKDNGPIEFVPGSHLLGDLKLLRHESDPAIKKFVRGDRKSVKVIASPGDVVVWHLLTIHGSEVNVSDESRMTYLSGFAHEDVVKAKKKFPVYMGML